MRNARKKPTRLALIAALALGCGSAQHAVAPGQEALVDGTFPAPLERQKRRALLVLASGQREGATAHIEFQRASAATP